MIRAGNTSKLSTVEVISLPIMATAIGERKLVWVEPQPTAANAQQRHKRTAQRQWQRGKRCGNHKYPFSGGAGGRIVSLQSARLAG